MRFSQSFLVSILLVMSIVFPVAGADSAGTSTVSTGLEIGAEFIVDSISTLDGGTTRATAVLGMTALTFDFDTAAAGLWRDGRALVQVVATFGDEPSLIVGDLQVADNIEAGDKLGVLEAWIEQGLFDRVFLLVGYHDLNREFDVLENAAKLLNSSFGIGPEISQIGPSIFPETHLGARIHTRLGETGYAKVAGYRGLSLEGGSGEDVPGGEFYAVEAGRANARVGPFDDVKVAVGGWKLRCGSLAEESSAWGGYVLAEGRRSLQDGGSIGAFLRAGRTFEGDYRVERYTGAGVRLEEVIAARPDDVLTLGVARAEIGKEQCRNCRREIETTVELSWVWRLNAWIAIQPDIQYVDAPAGTDGVDHALVGGLRFILAF